MRRLAMVILVALIASSASADQISPSPYVGQQRRAIKALSQSEIDGYLSGEGMGFAKAAELNHYPGPKHVLELSEPLQLSAQQRAATQRLFRAMRGEAVGLGKKLVDQERELDRLFSNQTIDDGRLESILVEIGMLRAKLRYVHLRAHLKQRDLLTPIQIERYDQLRGYGSGHPHWGAHHHHAQ